MEDLHPSDIAILTLFIIISVLGSIGNLCILAAIFKNSSLRRITHILIMNQALSDFLLSALSIPLRILRISAKKSILSSNHLSSDSYCHITSGLNAAVLGTSSFGLVLLTVDKFLAARKPFLYRTRLRKRHTIIPIVGSWLIPLAIGLFGGFIPALQADLHDHKHDVACMKSSTFGKAYALFAYIMILIVPLTIIFPLYIYIIVKVKRSGRILTHPANIEDALHQSFPTCQRRTVHDEAHRKKEMRLTRAVVLILGIHLFCFTPVVVLDVVHMILAHPIPHNLDEIFLLFLHLNAVLDAIIYTRHSKEIKRTIFRILYPCRHLVRFIDRGNNWRSTESTTVQNLNQQITDRNMGSTHRVKETNSVHLS